jgi:hypothetical protein
MHDVAEFTRFFAAAQDLLDAEEFERLMAGEDETAFEKLRHAREGLALARARFILNGSGGSLSALETLRMQKQAKEFRASHPGIDDHEVLRAVTVDA